LYSWEALLPRKRYTFVTVPSVLLFVSSVISAKAAAISWGQTYGSYSSDVAYSLVETSDGGYALAGSWEEGPSGCDCWLIKTDMSGNEEWNQTYEASTNNDWAYSLIVTSDGGYALAGVSNSSASSWDLPYGQYFYNDLGGDCWLIKTDATGEVEWNQTYRGTRDDWALSLINASDGGYALAGYTSSYGAGGRDAGWLRLIQLGIAQWNQTYGGTETCVGEYIMGTSDEGYMIAG
jgi:hypothetical protein